MFQNVLDELEKTHGITCPSFHLYLKRHILLDEKEHAPMGRKLLTNLCEDDDQKWQEAFDVSCNAIDARYAFWDGVVESLSALKQSKGQN